MHCDTKPFFSTWPISKQLKTNKVIYIADLSMKEALKYQLSKKINFYIFCVAGFIKHCADFDKAR